VGKKNKRMGNPPQKRREKEKERTRRKRYKWNQRIIFDSNVQNFPQPYKEGVETSLNHYIN